MKILGFDEDRTLQKRFLAFPRELYATDTNHLPDPGEEHWLSRVARHKFLATDGEQILGRAAVMINPEIRDPAGVPFGQIGFFECVDDASVATQLVQAATNWLKAAYPATRSLLAPINFDTWHSYRLRTRGFEQSSFLMEPYNPAYYPELLAASNFSEISRYVTKTVDDVSFPLSTWESYHQKALSRGYTFRTFDSTHLDDELALLYHLSTMIFRDNLFFVDIPEDEFRSLYREPARRVDPGMVIFVINPAGRPAGFSFSFPDHRVKETVNIKTLGVLPNEKGVGVGAALAYAAYKQSIEGGFSKINHCLMLAGNRADQFDRGHAEITREYALYTRLLQP